ncbi:hypothetical protein CAPTEDRAFT_212084 [Capitella teleta]|uniref:BLOC-1-related complex subunit 6 C-terminal helix domain-containing protein n=1 Tax=Capitella teleta TaxID=283909 RepID=R7U3Y1_CAPTE|nr:hypothetical protein CAPTEDRAFT_212084 [Capitella teleta]|eukprot:ELU01050.1 hypothetical protein CAPTEDRAFT_212084 [Capitella teleta]
MDLEVLAEKTSMSLQHMMSTLASDLHKMSSLTHACLGAYSEGVDNTCDAVDSSIKSMYALMAKCEELNSSLRPIYGLQEQIKGIKRLLDMFETQMAKSEKNS